MIDGLSDEQRMLAETALDTAAGLAADHNRSGREVWARLTGLGWAGALTSNASGGFGGTLVDLFLLSRAVGYHLLTTPFLSSAALVAPLLEKIVPAGTDRILRAHVSGEAPVALAYEETSGDPAGAHVATRAKIERGVWSLAGAKRMVLDGADARILIVSAMVEDPGVRDSLRLMFVPRTAEGVEIQNYRLIDGSRAADIRFDNVVLDESAAIMPSSLNAALAIDEAILTATVSAVGEALGSLEACLAQSIEHIKTRQQFDRPLASFQVLRHRVADMYIAVEELRSLGLAAARSEDTIERESAIRAAKIHLGHAGVWVAEQAVQLHGAMGVSEECRIGHYLKRITVLDRLFGCADFHIARAGARF